MKIFKVKARIPPLTRLFLYTKDRIKKIWLAPEDTVFARISHSVSLSEGGRIKKTWLAPSLSEGGRLVALMLRKYITKVYTF